MGRIPAFPAMVDPDIFSLFSDRAYYSAHFMDVGFWKPYVRQVCGRNGLIARKVRHGLPGTFPTFLVELGAAGIQEAAGCVVVKFFGPLFHGADAFNIELALENWLSTQPLWIYSPKIMAAGELNQDWRYLIFEYIPGLSIGQLRNNLSEDDWLSVAQQMGKYLRHLHSLTIPTLPEIAGAIQPCWDGYAEFLEKQRCNCLSNHQAWNDLPGHLLYQLEEFVSPLDQLIDFSVPPHLIHADLTADHLLGNIANGSWQTLAVIDWGDARTGNLLYELVALKFDLFASDKNLLRRFLDAYDPPDFYQSDFARKAFSTALLHEFPMPAWVYAGHQDCKSLNELAERLFGV